MVDSSNGTEEIDRRLRLLVNSVTDYAIYMLDAEGHVVTWNPGARRFKGYEAEEIIGHHFSRFFTDEDRARGLPVHVLGTARAEGRFESEGWRVRKDGERFWAHVVVDPIRDEQGELIGFAKITRDITQKKAAERALFESEQRFAMLVKGVRDYAIYMLNPNGQVSNWNAGAQAIKGYAADEIVGQHFSRFYTPEDRERGEPERALRTAVSEGKYENEAWRMRKDGTRFFASVIIDPIYDENGNLAGFAKITRDITDRRLAQQELEEARTALFQSQKLQALGELTGGIAHDFNNLITVIRGSAELLRRGHVTDEKRQRYLDAIMETADRASKLTDHLLAFGRRQALKPEVLEINVRMDAFGEVLQRTLGSRIEVVLDLQSDLWRVEVDPTQFETAVLNAAINARDAMPDGGRLTLSTRNLPSRDGDMVAVEIADTGSGMNQEVLERVFEPFFTTKPVGKGTGLGLSQIHGFAAQAGGRAEIRSTEGEGTILSLILPRSEKARDGQRKTDWAGRIPEGITVLLVEDNDLVRDFAGDLLADLGCHVLYAADADEALVLLDSRERIDLVFTDVVMPGKSGLELARLVRERRPGTPILLASGYSEDVLKGAASEFEVLRKPYAAETLSHAIIRQLAHAEDMPA